METTPQEQSGRLIHSFPKTAKERVQFSLKRYRDRIYADVRVWYSRENEDNFRPTKKGLCLPVEHLEDLATGLKRLHSALENGLNGLSENAPYAGEKRPG